MDIFTTQLTRVVQTPVKKANLKVKALLKEAGISEFKEDHDHLANHVYYFQHRQENERAEEKLPKHSSDQDLVEEKRMIQKTDIKPDVQSGVKDVVDDEEQSPQLDIFV
ncbi:MAG: hypothetical protein HRT38_07425 [Alteromonadaceae bacterium]|nr:hypothetical protein [Alteromonadaceae bacterium]